MEGGRRKPPTGEQPAPGGAAGQPPPARSRAASPPQSTEEQIEGLRAWIAQVDRRLGVRSVAGGVAVVLALAAGIVGVVLASAPRTRARPRTR